MPEPLRPLINPQKAPATLLDELLGDSKRLWAAIGIVLGLLGAGVTLNAKAADWFFGAHAVERFRAVEAKQKLQDERYDHLDKDIDALHQDVRAMASHEPLPPWTHVPLAEASPTKVPGAGP